MQCFMSVAALAVTYFIFAILLNSVGVVILQSIETFGVSKSEASVLEGFKDLSIAFVSFFIASLLPKVGYKLALLIGLALVGVAVSITPMVANFFMIKVLFAAIGVSFALVKVSVYASIGLLTKGKNEHSSLMNTIEGVFMLGTLFGYWLFSLFVTEGTSSLGWLNVYWVLSSLVIIAVLMILFSPIEHKVNNERAESKALHDFISMLKLAYKPLVLIFVISIFLYVLIEQGIGTWLPTFNRELLGLSLEVSVQMSSIFALGLAMGRLTAGLLLKRINWFPLLLACLTAMALLLLVVMPLTTNVTAQNVDQWTQAPLVAFLLPLIGFFMAPIYPVLNSVMLSSLPTQQHASMTGLIVVFSALGGTTGSIITGNVFQFLGGSVAFYFTLIPIAGLLLSLSVFRKKVELTAKGIEK